MKNVNPNDIKSTTMQALSLIKEIHLRFENIIKIESQITDKNLKTSLHINENIINESIISCILSIDKKATVFENIYINNLKEIKNINIYQELFERYENQKMLLTHTLDLILTTEERISYFKKLENSSPQNINNLKNLNEYLPIKRRIFQNLDQVSIEFESIKNTIENLELNEIEYIKRFKSETKLIEDEFKNKINELILNLENKFKAYDLKYDQTFKSNSLLSTGVDTGLKSLNNLNERTQKIELEFTSIIKKAQESAEFELSLTSSSLEQKIENAISDVHKKNEEIEELHSKFKSMVEKAGIYDLTKNYQDKAEKEENEYKEFRKFTAWSIIAAIISTLLIFIIAFFEHYFTGKNNQTNFLLLISRLSISVMFFVLAFYLSKQAAKHYECYQENHRTFLQLAALEPFMANMTPEEKQEIRKGLIPSYFNQGVDGKFATKGDEVDLPTNMYALMNRTLDLVVEKKESKAAENVVAETKPSV